MNSAEYFARAKLVIPGGVNSPVRAFGNVGIQPPYIVRAQGAYMWDAEGNRYIDMIGSWGPMILGHAYPGVVERAQKAAADGMSFGACCPDEVELAEFICRAVSSVELVRMVSSGTEAAMSAVRAARGFTGRNLIVKFEGCYHGHSDALMSKAGSGLMTLGLPGSAGVPEGAARDTVTLPYNDIASLNAFFNKKGSEVAAVIIEPVAANMGVVIPSIQFLREIRRLTRDYDALLVFDEVITGFRLGLSGAQGHYNIEPDLTVFGKIIGGGFPVGAYGGREDVMGCVAPLGPVYQAGTLSGNPVAMAAGLATLRALSADSQLYSKLDANADTLARGMIMAAEKHGVTASVNRVGSLMTLFFTKGHVHDYTTAAKSDTGRYACFFRYMLDNGVYFAPSQFEAAFLSAAHSREDIEFVINAFDAFCEMETRSI